MRRALHHTAASSNSSASSSHTTCMLRISSVSTMMLFPLLLATATATATASLASPVDRSLMYSNSVDEGPITQLDLLPFLLTLKPTPDVLDGEDSLETYVQTVVEDYIASQVSGLDYVLLAGIESVDWNSGEEDRRRHLRTAAIPSTTIKFVGGVASFSEPVAEDYNVNTGAMEAIASNLVPLLQGTEFSGILSAAYITTTEAPTSAPTQQQNTVVVGGVQSTNNTYEKDNTRHTGAIVGALLGVAFVVLASILLIRKHNQVHAMRELDPEDKQPQVDVDDDDDAATEVDDVELDQQQQQAIANECASQQAHYHDAASTDQGSVVSEWTLTSRDTSTGGLRTNEMLVHAETFERDRQVALRKDVLQSPWSGGGAAVVSPRQQSSMPLPLQPPRRRGRQDFASWRTEQGDVDSDSPFRFEPANEAQGEEVYLMPPTRARKSEEANKKHNHS
jgi:hypothetical protein